MSLIFAAALLLSIVLISSDAPRVPGDVATQPAGDIRHAVWTIAAGADGISARIGMPL